MPALDERLAIGTSLGPCWYHGSVPFHPALLLPILVYGYATGVFSSRKLENTTYSSVACRFVTADEHMDNNTLNTFPKCFLKEIKGLMVQALMIARTLSVLNLGNARWMTASSKPTLPHIAP